MKYVLLILLTPAAVGCATWSGRDIAIEAAWQTVNAVDWGTTRNIARDPDNYREIGLLGYFVGEHPSVAEVDVFCAVGAVGHALISGALPDTSHVWGHAIHPRRIWQMITISASVTAVANNISMGLRMDFGGWGRGKRRPPPNNSPANNKHHDRR